ncbi:hypothetical protein FUSO4_10815 [Fusobacterium necrophorum DJ-1]|uniref:Uncharacterized protein n=2 Tax=Fusobacterium necrophorum TaxID=859 RepID=A0AAN4AUC7_9FUSO|nr:hypothetical protein HMPREF1127_1946 [Fusobacterium necrophorum subsp. funduliforme Fnf 1007]KDE62020.1 hypothetical protein FUSO4_10815 [Fusobacterium necrophorum DJ-1]KDE73115.1 hypothetical protein FUSO8_02535 [Fusobacterium necrophorum DJ-2]
MNFKISFLKKENEKILLEFSGKKKIMFYFKSLHTYSGLNAITKLEIKWWKSA